MTVNSTRDFIPPEPFEGQNYKPRYARPSASLREEICPTVHLHGAIWSTRIILGTSEHFGLE